MSSISKRNRLTIPAEALRAAGLAPGDDVRVVASGQGRLEVVRVQELLAEFAGALGEREYPAGYLEGLREEWPERDPGHHTT
jgi:bifunctional DNA-binding transcriptional regulator/antitoxin component of YhaV-PrlF toxin-antitoxin module